MLTFTVEELIRFLSNWTMTFFEGAKRSGDIVFSRYYSFFKHPVLVREHQVESLYVMVQNRDSSDNKKPSFSRFAKWEFGGFIVDSKTIYMASKPVKALLQSSDFIDDMDVFEKLDSIRIPLFRKNIPADPAMFQDIFWFRQTMLRMIVYNAKHEPSTEHEDIAIIGRILFGRY